MLREIAGWWGRQWRDRLPALSPEDPGRATALVLRLGEGGLSLALRRHGREKALLPPTPPDLALPGLRAACQRHRRAATRLILALPPGGLPPGGLLERTVELPLAAEAGLDGLLRHELDRLTPFAATEALFGWTALRRDPARQKLSLRLWVTPRDRLRPALDALALLGRQPAWLEAAGQGGPLRLASAPGQGQGQGQGQRQGQGWRGPRLAATLCASLLLAASATPLLRQSLALAAVEAEIATLRPAQAETTALRRAMAANTGETTPLARERTRLGDPLPLLATLTDTLPQESFLTEFTATPGLRDPLFTAPIRREAESNSDLFTLRLAP
ncbi:hypothetical protein NON00_15720 [Roseomonas sp. GC11]|uniref:hypothetical protein n=1 Tax=Roseomonas sp. GC11 TaxID=2950546 RepID=UPI002108E93F|nr:hypothetical protein [Roseomonas sp. GC11]MCQ4161368.1 hypothetical protein [Roseomonas sp. GC11]